MSLPRVNYNELARSYHSRYEGRPLTGVLEVLLGLARDTMSQRALEVGCGTGYWIEYLCSAGMRVFGADASHGMLVEAARRLGPSDLVVARANALPFDSFFDLIFSVNAFHHFDNPKAFVTHAHGLLEPGGLFAIIGIDPRTIRRRYYYEYFTGALHLDLQRYRSFGDQVDWMAAAGFDRVDLRIVETIVTNFSGREIFDDPFLAKTSNPLFALLTDDAYREGLRRIEQAVTNAEVRGEHVEFRSELPVGMVSGRRAF